MPDPNEYSLHGDNITITYWPHGSGPVLEGFGRVALVYAAGGEERRFAEADVTTTPTPIGSLVTVTLVAAPARDVTTFTVILPPVELSGGPGSEAPLHVPAISAVGRDPEVLNEPALTYKVMHLSGTAKIVEVAAIAAP